ncbi:MAG TPA: glycosyltransferase [Gemmataceae bacterium]|nr:glycosyltransferase [Gemmataceae bacterium]
MTDHAAFFFCGGLAVFFLVVAPFLPRQRTGARTLMVALGLAVTARYLCWRLFATVWPAELLTFAGFWFLFLYGFEVVGYVNQFLLYLVLTYVADRSTEADRLEAELRVTPPDQLPRVDVFITTYNEGLDVVERTIVAALALDYPNYKVWVLDDGDRDWLRDFCEAKGAGYLRRSEHRHAKAGNINHALSVTSAELFVVLDADFAPFHNFLYRTVGFFRDPRIAILQTPQHFFNPDPIQLNLGISATWPDDQRLFFDVILPARDAWDCAWCCGSCSVQRREAIVAVGGVPTDSITEDLLSTLVLLRKGYITRYLNERLSMGLAPENLEGYFRQRERWCRGNLQTVFLKSGPLGPGLSLLQRVLFLPLDWVLHYVIRLLTILVPIIYLWTGLGPFLIPSPGELFSYQLPVLIALVGSIRWFAPNSYLPIVSSASALFTSFRIVPTGLATLIKPFGTPFKVTPKGSSITFSFGDMMVLGSVIILMLLTLGGLIKNRLDPSDPTANSVFMLIAEAWALINLVVLAVTALIAIESARPRKEERFQIDKPAAYRVADAEFPCRICNLSISGAFLTEVHAMPPDGKLELLISGIGLLPGRVTRTQANSLALCFDDLSAQDRDRLIQYIYAAGRCNAVQRVKPWKVMHGLLQSFGRE